MSLGQIQSDKRPQFIKACWAPGLALPDAKGAIIGFGDVHTRAHVYRAVIEGLGFAMYDGLARIEKAGGVKAQKASVSGDASQSDEIWQNLQSHGSLVC